MVSLFKSCVEKVSTRWSSSGSKIILESADAYELIDDSGEYDHKFLLKTIAQRLCNLI